MHHRQLVEPRLQPLRERGHPGLLARLVTHDEKRLLRAPVGGVAEVLRRLPLVDLAADERVHVVPDRCAKLVSPARRAHEERHAPALRVRRAGEEDARGRKRALELVRERRGPGPMRELEERHVVCLHAVLLPLQRADHALEDDVRFERVRVVVAPPDRDAVLARELELCLQHQTLGERFGLVGVVVEDRLVRDDEVEPLLGGEVEDPVGREKGRHDSGDLRVRASHLDRVHRLVERRAGHVCGD